MSPAGMPEVTIFGLPISDFAALPTSHLGLLCGYGEVDDQSVLVPYLQMRLLAYKDASSASEDTEVTEAFRATVAFENAAFLIMDLARDFRTATQRLQTLSSGDLRPEPMRIAYAKRCMGRARTAIAEAIGYLDEIEPAPQPEVEAPKAAPVRKPVRPKPKV